MRASLIKGFRNVTENVENVVRKMKFSPDDRTPINDGKGNWSRQELWMAAKIVSQFNFFTAFELALKFLLRVTKKGPAGGHNHDFTQLYDALLGNEKSELETLFSPLVLAPGLKLGRAIQTGTTPNSQKETFIKSLRDFCAYCDKEAKFFKSRYAYENVESDNYLHFINDISGLITFLDKVEQVTRERWDKSRTSR